MKWLSWYQPTEDHRPVSYPPNEGVLAWFCTGRSERGATIVALIEADTEEQAKEIALKDWPEIVDWRFCEDKHDRKLSNRFPVSDWMLARGCYNEKTVS